jgi:acylphosphatase
VQLCVSEKRRLLNITLTLQIPFCYLREDSAISFKEKRGDLFMKQCLKITVFTKPTGDFLQDLIRKQATKFSLEGTAQVAEDEKIIIIICGEKENIDHFLDALHKGTATQKPDRIELEPFFKEKDYRGVFRIIE